MTQIEPNEGTQSLRPPSGNAIWRPVAIVVLYLAGFAFAFTPIVGVVLAYVWRGEDETPHWEETHFTYLITTFWIGLVISLLFVAAFFGAFLATLPLSHGSGDPPFAFLLSMVGILMAGGLAALWYLIRCILSLAKAGSARPMPNPTTLLF